MHVLLLRSRLLAFLGLPDLLDNTHFLESYYLSVRVPDGAEKKHNGSLANLKGCGPVATSVRGTDRRVGFEGAEQGAQSSVVLRLRWWKEVFIDMINRNFARHLMMGVFSRVCSGVLWGIKGVSSVGFW
jgi:hypothetical protein